MSSSHEMSCGSPAQISSQHQLFHQHLLFVALVSLALVWQQVSNKAVFVAILMLQLLKSPRRQKRSLGIRSVDVVAVTDVAGVCDGKPKAGTVDTRTTGTSKQGSLAYWSSTSQPPAQGVSKIGPIVARAHAQPIGPSPTGTTRPGPWLTQFRFFRFLLQRLQVTLVRRQPPQTLCCATEYKVQSASEIALNAFLNKWLYRFKPGSTITVSINESSFRNHSEADREYLRRAVKLTLSMINNFNIGIDFRYITTESSRQRGVVELRYGGNRTSILPDNTISRVWADTEFPNPIQPSQQYAMNIYSATFDPNYCHVIINILCHEFAHLLSMRHHPAVPAYSEERDRVVFPEWDDGTASIMGSFSHPGQLFFSDLDIEHLQKFFQMRAGDKIHGKTIVDVDIPV